MLGDNNVVQVVRAVANGNGDWADVPRCVREAVVMALAGPQSQLAQRIDVMSSAGGATAKQRCRSPWPAPRDDSRPVAPSLSEETVQSSVRTFEDAAWLRDQAVRSFAQFHNTVEALREAMRHHLRSLWRTALQLDPRLLGDVRRRRRLEARDEIPEDITVTGDVAQRLVDLEALVDEIGDYVHTLRGASLRFAACALSDEEKQVMGLDPADLRPEDVAPCCVSPQRAAPLGHTAGACGDNCSDRPQLVPPQCSRKMSRRSSVGMGSTEGLKVSNSLPLSEVQQRYMNQIALLNEESLRRVAEDVISCRLSSLSSGNDASANVVVSNSMNLP